MDADKIPVNTVNKISRVLRVSELIHALTHTCVTSIYTNEINIKIILEKPIAKIKKHSALFISLD